MQTYVKYSLKVDNIDHLYIICSNVLSSPLRNDEAKMDILTFAKTNAGVSAAVWTDYLNFYQIVSVLQLSKLSLSRLYDLWHAQH